MNLFLGVQTLPPIDQVNGANVQTLWTGARPFDAVISEASSPKLTYSLSPGYHGLGDRLIQPIAWLQSKPHGRSNRYMDELF